MNQSLMFRQDTTDGGKIMETQNKKKEVIIYLLNQALNNKVIIDRYVEHLNGWLTSGNTPEDSQIAPPTINKIIFPEK